MQSILALCSANSNATAFALETIRGFLKVRRDKCCIYNGFRGFLGSFCLGFGKLYFELVILLLLSGSFFSLGYSPWLLLWRSGLELTQEVEEEEQGQEEEEEEEER